MARTIQLSHGVAGPTLTDFLAVAVICCGAAADSPNDVSRPLSWQQPHSYGPLPCIRPRSPCITIGEVPATSSGHVLVCTLGSLVIRWSAADIARAANQYGSRRGCNRPCRVTKHNVRSTTKGDKTPWWRLHRPGTLRHKLQRASAALRRAENYGITNAHKSGTVSYAGGPSPWHLRQVPDGGGVDLSPLPLEQVGNASQVLWVKNHDGEGRRVNTKAQASYQMAQLTRYGPHTHLTRLPYHRHHLLVLS